MMARTIFIMILICCGTASKINKTTEPPFHFLKWYGIFKKEEICPFNEKGAAVLHEYFYKVLSFFDRKSCVVKKCIGGQWPRMSDELKSWCERQGNCETWPQIDGVKKICIDKIYKHVLSGSCLLYSFGLNDDWSFEHIMASLGCKVRSFDPTIDGPPVGFDWPNNLSFKKIGISNQTEKVEMSNITRNNMKFSLDTLENIIHQMDDKGKNLNVLKLDIEGYEFSVLPKLIDSYLIDSIDQIIVEIHSNEGSERSYEDLNLLLRSVDTLKSIGFFIINYDPNLTMGRFSKPYYFNFDITLMRQK